MTLKKLKSSQRFDWLYGCEVHGTIKFYLEETQMTQDSFLEMDKRYSSYKGGLSSNKRILMMKLTTFAIVHGVLKSDFSLVKSPTLEHQICV